MPNNLTSQQFNMFYKTRNIGESYNYTLDKYTL